ncbi:MAG TPA: CaiB/BaiF CoA-transferase family protein [Reyranella sp.]|nr:CaiB/BaiF CoA-transferase family protein [Reyranella sp.]
MGPLAGVRIVELGGIGPGPFASMLFSEMGAEVLRIGRRQGADKAIKGFDKRHQLLNRGRRSVAMDLKNRRAVDAVRKLIATADAVIEGFRPGVVERLGLGPEECLRLNPKLVYGRITGWGQDGPLAAEPGHDINYIALTGALHAIGRKDGPPVSPLNLVGDFGGGALYLAFGMICAILEARSSGKGQVVDAAMVDGVSSLMTLMYGMHAAGLWTDDRGSNRLDSGTPWYDVYETSDGKWISVGCNEPQFYEALLNRLGVERSALPADRHDRKGWPAIRACFSQKFREKTRDEWCEIMKGSEVCFAPVLSMAEAPRHPHMKARGTFVELDGVVQPAPAPRFSRTKPEIRHSAGSIDQQPADVLRDWGFGPDEVADLRADGAIG